MTVIVSEANLASFRDPIHFFATAPDTASPSLRSWYTVIPLAKDLGLPIDTRFAVHQEPELVSAATTAAPVVLISWHHERNDNNARLLGVTTTGVWPDERFDLVWVFDRIPAGWRFSEETQNLLPGDV